MIADYNNGLSFPQVPTTSNLKTDDLSNPVWKPRTPPDKPIYCCKKGCVAQFRIGDSRMKHLKDSYLEIRSLF